MVDYVPGMPIYIWIGRDRYLTYTVTVRPTADARRWMWAKSIGTVTFQVIASSCPQACLAIWSAFVLLYLSF